MIHVTSKDEFETEVLKASETVLVDFFAPWCGPCQILGQTIEELDTELTGDQKVVKINVDEAPDLAGEYAVMSIPALKVFKNGEMINESVGVKSKEELKALLA